MSTILQTANSLQPDSPYLELWDFDASLIGGSTYYYTNTPTGDGPIKWRSNNYYPLPFEVTGIMSKGDGTAPNRPTISIGNANQFLIAAVLTLGDLIGMKVTRWRTFLKYTDEGTEPDAFAYFDPDEYIITKKLPSAIKSVLQFEMSNALDRPGLKLPRRQVLRDSGFPGVARQRVK